MAWVAVDKSGTECIYEDEPIRCSDMLCVDGHHDHYVFLFPG